MRINHAGGTQPLLVHRISDPSREHGKNARVELHAPPVYRSI
jgi:hypothetical protein